MRKLIALLVAVLVVALAAPVGAGDEFVLIGANAARAYFTNDAGCAVEVSYVDAVAVRYFDGELAMPHEDVDVILWGTCGPRVCNETSPCRWTRNISGGHPDAEIVRLSSAHLDAFDVFDGVQEQFWAVADLEWTADGKPYKDKTHEPGTRSNGRAADAIVTGTLTVYVETTEMIFTTAAHLDDGSHIGYYTAIVKDNLP